jgi:hypothetical protein
MTITKNSSYFPIPVLIVPHNNEISDSIALATSELAEAMRALLNGAEVFYREDFESVWHKLTAEISAHILLCVGEHFLPRPRDATCVMVELNVWHEIAGVLLKLLRGAATVECVEYSGIKR